MTMPSKMHFEKRRASDNIVRLENKLKVEDDIMKEIFEKKEVTRKTINVSSINISSSVTPSNTKKAFNYYSQPNGKDELSQSKKCLLSKTPSTTLQSTNLVLLN